MTGEEATKMVDIINNYWPTLKIENEKLVVFMNQLSRYTFASAKREINSLLSEWQRPGHPPVGVIFARLKLQASREPCKPSYNQNEEDGQPDYKTDPSEWGPIRCWLEDKIWRRDNNKEPGPTLSEMIKKVGL